MMTVQEAACALGADWYGENAFFTGVSTDSRTIKHGDLFVALCGARFDGYQFIASAREQGAVAALVKKGVDRGDLPAGFGWIEVCDTRLGLGQLAACWRARFSLPLVAVTGSNGKTTVKEMIACIFHKATINEGDAAAGRVLATIGNLNNDIGVPQMLLRLTKQHAYAVIEMGMNHAGEIAYLTNLAKPTVAVITNAGAAHIEGLGSIDAVARAKGEIFAGLSDAGAAVINADDTHASLWRTLAENRHIIDFSLNGPAQVTAFHQSDSSGGSWVLKVPEGCEQLRLQTLGRHNIYNALAAAATAVAVGIDKQTIAAGLQAFPGVRGRLQKKPGLNKASLIDDTYNANPESMRAALAVLANEPGKKVLVLGDMGELGPSAADFHHQIGAEASQAGIDELLALGNLSKHAAAGFGSGARHFSSMDDLLAEAEKLLDINVTMLVKGSRFMQMERVIRQFEI